MNRRSFLKKGLLGGALLALGGAGLALSPTRTLAQPRRRLLVVDERGFQVLVAIAARVVTVPGADPAAIAHGVDEALSRAVPDAQKDLASLLGLFENALPGLLLDGRARPFTQLGPEAQDRVLESWRDSRLVLRRGGYHALRKLCLGVYYGGAETWPALHYAGPPDLGGFAHDDSKAGTPEWLAAREAGKEAP
jgi:hypothetical protein